MKILKNFLHKNRPQGGRYTDNFNQHLRHVLEKEQEQRREHPHGYEAEPTAEEKIEKWLAEHNKSTQKMETAPVYRNMFEAKQESFWSDAAICCSDSKDIGEPEREIRVDYSTHRVLCYCDNCYYALWLNITAHEQIRECEKCQETTLFLWRCPS